MKWISIKDKLPKHSDNVLVYTKNDSWAVVIFVDNEEVYQSLKKQFIFVPEAGRDGYAFCSQESPGSVLNGVTHWMPLWKPKDENPTS